MSVLQSLQETFVYGLFKFSIFYLLIANNNNHSECSEKLLT